WRCLERQIQDAHDILPGAKRPRTSTGSRRQARGMGQQLLKRCVPKCRELLVGEEVADRVLQVQLTTLQQSHAQGASDQRLRHRREVKNGLRLHGRAVRPEAADRYVEGHPAVTGHQSNSPWVGALNRCLFKELSHGGEPYGIEAELFWRRRYEVLHD